MRPKGVADAQTVSYTHLIVAACQAKGLDLYEAKTTVENEKDMEKAVAEVTEAGDVYKRQPLFWGCGLEIENSGSRHLLGRKVPWQKT